MAKKPDYEVAEFEAASLQKLIRCIVANKCMFERPNRCRQSRRAQLDPVEPSKSRQ